MSGRVTPRAAGDGQAARTAVTRYAVPGWGSGELWLRGAVMLAHELDYTLPGRSRAASDGITGELNGHALDLVHRFRAFLAGEDVPFDDVELELEWATPFQRALTIALRDVPRGEVVSYGELAALAGRPGAARAAGTFCATNRFALVVPCHRVVAADGIGGYGRDGVPIKRRLLALEGVRL